PRPASNSTDFTHHSNSGGPLVQGRLLKVIEAIPLDAKSAFVYCNRGDAWLGKADYDRAIADYSEAIRLDPSCMRAYNNRGLDRHDKGDDDRAITDFNEAIRLDPSYAPAYYNRSRAWWCKGE